MQVRRGTGRVNALDVRDQQASVGHRDTLPEAGRDMLVMYPADAQKRAQLGDAALPAHVTTQLVADAYRTAHRMSSAVGQFDPIWASICEQRSGPRYVTLLRIGGVHHEHVSAGLGQRVPMASACLLVTYIE